MNITDTQDKRLWHGQMFMACRHDKVILRTHSVHIEHAKWFSTLKPSQ